VNEIEAHIRSIKKMPPKLKASSTKWLRPTMLYRAECWPVKSSHIQKIKGCGDEDDAADVWDY